MAVEVLDRIQAAGADVAWVVAGAGGAAAYRRRAAGEEAPEGVHQAHVRDAGLWVDVVLEPWTDAAWRYRRAPAIGLPLARAVRRVPVAGVEVPVLAPAAVLLFKATTGGRSMPAGQGRRGPAAGAGVARARRRRLVARRAGRDGVGAPVVRARRALGVTRARTGTLFRRQPIRRGPRPSQPA